MTTLQRPSEGSPQVEHFKLLSRTIHRRGRAVVAGPGSLELDSTKHPTKSPRSISDVMVTSGKLSMLEATSRDLVTLRRPGHILAGKNLSGQLLFAPIPAIRLNYISA